MDEFPKSIREQALALLSKKASMWGGRFGEIDYVSHRVKTNVIRTDLSAAVPSGTLCRHF
jgi:hypothetical protein